MNIVLAYPAQLPAFGYGGTQRVVAWLAKGLVEGGYKVSVLSYPESTSLHGAHCIGLDKDKWNINDLSKMLPENSDILHLMAPFSSEELDHLKIPFIMTVHGNGKPNEKFPKQAVFLSQNHAKRHGSTAFVYNGLDPSEYLCRPIHQRSNYWTFLAKTTWRVKNLRGAYAIASRAQVPLWIAGGAGPWDVRLRVKFKRHLNWNWCGEVDNQEKREILSRSRGYLFPVLWDEPFGLSVVESLLSGCPVVATARGSLRELLFHSELGQCIDLYGGKLAYGDWLDLWSESIHSLTNKKWEPEFIRSLAIEKFHYQKMTESYLSIYKDTIGGK